MSMQTTSHYPDPGSQGPPNVSPPPVWVCQGQNVAWKGVEKNLSARVYNNASVYSSFLKKGMTLGMHVLATE